MAPLHLGIHNTHTVMEILKMTKVNMILPLAEVLPPRKGLGKSWGQRLLQLLLGLALGCGEWRVGDGRGGYW